MEYLPLTEVRARSRDVHDAIADLVGRPVLAPRPRAKQWRFLRELTTVLLDHPTVLEFASLAAPTVAQLKFQVEARLRQYYNAPGRTVDWVFTIVHRRDLHLYVPHPGSYPTVAGYALLVRPSTTAMATSPRDRAQLTAYLESVIQGAIDAEFRAYARLPTITTADIRDLERYFTPGSPAIQEILTVLYRHQERGWVLTNPYNPSTKRLLKVTVASLTATDAIIRTTEYWYLRWWSIHDQEYTYPYRETNRQRYLLGPSGDVWKVIENQRPPPRSMAAHRRRK